MFKVKNTKLAYLSGFFGREGCISITKGENHLGNIQYSLRVIVSNTNDYVLQLYKFSLAQAQQTRTVRLLHLGVKFHSSLRLPEMCVPLPDIKESRSRFSF